MPKDWLSWIPQAGLAITGMSGLSIMGVMQFFFNRTGEVFLATHNYQEALECFQRAFQCNDSDKVVCKELMDKSRREAGLDLRQAE